jgi:hypothetical protein
MRKKNKNEHDDPLRMKSEMRKKNGSNLKDQLFISFSFEKSAKETLKS